MSTHIIILFIEDGEHKEWNSVATELLLHAVWHVTLHNLKSRLHAKQRIARAEPLLTSGAYRTAKRRDSVRSWLREKH